MPKHTLGYIQRLKDKDVETGPKTWTKEIKWKITNCNLFAIWNFRTLKEKVLKKIMEE